MEETVKLKNAGYEYEVREDGTVYLTKYVGADSVITIPSEIDGAKVTVIGKYCFLGNETIEEVTIPDTVEVIDRFAFADCPILSMVSVPPSVETMGKHAFLECASLHRLKMPTEAEKSEFRAAKIRAEEEARLKAEEEARLRAEEEERLHAEAEAKIRAEEEAKLRAEEETRIKAEEEAALRERIRAELEAKIRAEAEAELLAASTPAPAPAPAPVQEPVSAVRPVLSPELSAAEDPEDDIDLSSLTPIQRSIEVQKRRMAAEAREGTAPYSRSSAAPRRPVTVPGADVPPYIPAAAQQQTPPISRIVAPRTQRPQQRPMERMEPTPAASPSLRSAEPPRTAPRTTTPRNAPQRTFQTQRPVPPSRPSTPTTPSRPAPATTSPRTTTTTQRTGDAPITRSIFGFKKKPVYKQEREASANEWKCPECGLVNANYVTTCACGYRKRAQRKHEEDF